MTGIFTHSDLPWLAYSGRCALLAGTGKEETLLFRKILGGGDQIGLQLGPGARISPQAGQTKDHAFNQ
ncbi:hypothetical protein KTAU_24190 [Thermogemmatispora aurantia]|uniref:Uncharacterized protein n=1 Tax=Thermogemmatispora aurantia TaxID=2045279 RepID=A0A5J4K9M3_9CHLR|nr:hypothetical protein KTAU_24190 [Thermogemmatispora aurantia]